MTAVWDIIQEFLTKIGTLKDPEYYSDALRYVKDLIGDIHEIDHDIDERISNNLFKTSRAYDDIEKFLRKLKHEIR